MVSSTRRTGLFTGLHLGVLFVLAVSQPLLDLLARNAEFLVAHRAGRADVAGLLLVLLGLLPALPGTTCAVSAKLGGGARRLVTQAWVAALGALVVLRACRLLLPASGGIAGGMAGLPAGALAGVLGILLAWAYWRSRTLRFCLGVVSPVVLVVGGLFVANPAVLATLAPDESERGALPDSGIRSSVAVVVFDALSLGSLLDAHGRIDAVRYPAFAELASQADFFPLATSVSDSTTRSIPSLLTGRRPDPGRQPRYADHRDNLFTLLGATHRLHVLETDTHLCPDWLCAGVVDSGASSLSAMLADLVVVYAHVVVPAPLEAGLPPISDSWKGFGAARPSPRNPPHEPILRAFLDGIQTSDRPQLLYLHVYAPHTPYYYLPSGRAYRTHSQEASGQGDQWAEWNADDEWAVLQSQQRYLLQVGYADRVLGLFLARMRELGLYDETLLVVTADHGTSFWPGRARRKLTPVTARDVASVPLLIKRPGQSASRVDSRPVELVDVLPSIFDALGVPLLVPVDGRSVFADPAARGPKRILAGAGGVLRIPPERFEGTDPSVVRMHAHFGTGDWSEVLRLGPCPELVGRRVAALLAGSDPALRIHLLEPGLYSDVDPDTGFVPAEVIGLVDPRDSSMELAIAIDGVVAATTRSYPETGAFSAIVDETLLSRGAHRVEALAIRTGTAGPELVAGTAGGGRAGFVGMRLGHRSVIGVSELGFYPARPGARGASRWTTGLASLRVPLGPDDHPTRLEIELSARGRPPTHIEVRANGCRLYAGRLSGETWHATLPLSGCPISGDGLRLELQSEPYRNPTAPSGTIEQLGLGVRVRGLTLLEEPDPS